MALNHLHARLFEGSLAAPTRDELQTDETDNYDAAVAQAKELSRQGFAAWVYRHQPVPAQRPGAPGPQRGYEVVAEWRANGARVR